MNLAGNYAGDPRILYDAPSGHWFASSLDGGSSNRILVAVSNDADPLHGWKGYSFPPAGGGTADFDMLGINKESVYIASDLGTTVAILPKADLINGSIANRTVLTAFGVGSAPSRSSASATRACRTRSCRISARWEASRRSP